MRKRRRRSNSTRPMPTHTRIERSPLAILGDYAAEASTTSSGRCRSTRTASMAYRREGLAADLHRPDPLKDVKRSCAASGLIRAAHPIRVVRSHIVDDATTSSATMRTTVAEADAPDRGSSGPSLCLSMACRRARPARPDRRSSRPRWTRRSRSHRTRSACTCEQRVPWMQTGRLRPHAGGTAQGRAGRADGMARATHLIRRRQSAEADRRASTPTWSVTAA